MQKKTIVLGMPASNDIYQSVIKNLEYCGFHVISVVQPPELFKYPSVGAWLKTKYRKVVKGDRKAKRQLQAEMLCKVLEKELSEHGSFDYALFIRADSYHRNLLSFIQQHVKNGMVHYQWDGMNRFPEIWEMLPFFKHNFIFDPNDQALSDSFLPITNFYFDYESLNFPESYDFYFIGYHIPERAEKIARFARYAENRNYSLKFDIQHPKKKHHTELRKIYPDTIRILAGETAFSDAQRVAKESRVLVDFVVGDHKGLSLRTFEALHYNKKLITTNSTIQYYDFYHPDNIFIWDGEHFDGLDDFLARPYQLLPSEIYQKYSFSNWIHYVLDIPPYQRIMLPTLSTEDSAPKQTNAPNS